MCWCKTVRLGLQVRVLALLGKCETQSITFDYFSTFFNLKDHHGKWKWHISQSRTARTRPSPRLQACNDLRDLSDMIRGTDASPRWLKCAVRGRNGSLQLIFTNSPVAAWFLLPLSKNRVSRKGHRIWPLVSLSFHHRKHADRCNKWLNELRNQGSRLVTIWTMVLNNKAP